mmetsp:Transcript_587/g.1811  ORF Transcript_587/g.1811 Transcript_587/m.1811 type:complete len:227 (-) Transcript_587:9-689(-)
MTWKMVLGSLPGISMANIASWHLGSKTWSRHSIFTTPNSASACVTTPSVRRTSSPIRRSSLSSASSSCFRLPAALSRLSGTCRSARANFVTPYLYSLSRSVGCRFACCRASCLMCERFSSSSSSWPRSSAICFRRSSTSGLSAASLRGSPELPAGCAQKARLAGTGSRRRCASVGGRRGRQRAARCSPAGHSLRPALAIIAARGDHSPSAAPTCGPGDQNAGARKA